MPYKTIVRDGGSHGMLGLGLGAACAFFAVEGILDSVFAGEALHLGGAARLGHSSAFNCLYLS